LARFFLLQKRTGRGDDTYLDNLDVDVDDFTSRLWEYNSVELMTQIQACQISNIWNRNRSSKDALERPHREIDGREL